jgi:hypothetical protein
LTSFLMFVCFWFEFQKRDEFSHSEWKNKKTGSGFLYMHTSDRGELFDFETGLSS